MNIIVRKDTKFIAGLAVFLLGAGGITYGLWQNREAISTSVQRTFYPNEYVTWLDRARVEAAAEKYDQALKFSLKAIQLRPDSYKAHGCAADCYLHLKQYEKAIVEYTTAIGLKSSHARSYLGRGQAYAETGQFDAARRDFRQGFRLDSSIHEFAMAECAMYLKAGKLLNAVEAAQEIDDQVQQPWTRDLTFEMARILILNDLKIVQKRPTDDRVWATLALGYSAARETDKALTCIDKALEIDRGNSALYVIRARIDRRANNLKAAKHDANLALLANASNMVARDLLQLVEKEISEEEKALAAKKELEKQNVEIEQLKKLKATQAQSGK